MSQCPSRRQLKLPGIPIQAGRQPICFRLDSRQDALRRRRHHGKPYGIREEADRAVRLGALLLFLLLGLLLLRLLLLLLVQDQKK